MNNTKKRVFMASNSAEGFVHYFGEFYNPKGEYTVFILKGGPGTGKSSFMRFMAQKSGEDAIICPCTADPHSIDAVILPERKIIFFDGTSPHTAEPVLPAVCEQIINLGEFWNANKIKEHKNEIIEIWDKNKFYHKTASRYISAAGQLYADNLKIARNCILGEKVNSEMGKLIKKHLKSKGKKAQKIKCFLSGITPSGIVNFTETVTGNFENIVVIEDKYGAVSGEILRGVAAAALLKGFKTVTAQNPFLPNELFEHILIPELSLAFVTENDFIKWDIPVRRIHARRFYSFEELKQKRGRLFFNRRIFRSLLLSAENSLSCAKKLHDNLEKYYVDAMDFSALSKYAENLADEIFG